MERRPTIHDVAMRAGVSKTTVSRVLANDGSYIRDSTRERVEAAIVELGYEPNAVASNLRTDRTNTVMLAIPDITNPFWPDVARGVQDRMEQDGYAVVFANSDWEGQREKTFLQMARRNRLDGMLINPIQVTHAELLASRIPTVLLGSREDYPAFDAVGSDSYGAAFLALEHLTRLGHQRIGFIQGRRINRPSHSRLDGYLDFLRSRGIPRDEALIVVESFDFAGGHRGLQHLLALPEPPTAVLAANDMLALGALQAGHQAGLGIPGDLSIVGMDDIFAASTATPPLTTVAKPKYEIGHTAAGFLLERIRGDAPEKPRRLLYPCALQQRGSTARRREPAERTA